MKLFTLSEVCEYLNIKKRTFYRMLERGSFPVEPVEGIKPRRWNIAKIEEYRKKNEKN